MNTNQGRNPATSDDDFLSGDNKSRPYPNQENPNEGYEKSMSPSRGSNPNIGGNESEYETSTQDEDRFDNEIPDNSDFEDTEDPDYNAERDAKRGEETRYNSPSRSDS